MPRNLFLVIIISCLAVLAAGVPSGPASVVTFSNDKRFMFDVDGNQIDAYAATIDYFTTTAGGKYYLYGVSFATPSQNPLGGGGIKSYSSVDLINWEYEGILGNVTGGRPHILYNADTEKYVLWVNAGTGYQVATSSSPSSDFTLVGDAALDPKFVGLTAADAAVESFGDQAYLAFSELNFNDSRAGSLWPPLFQTMHLSPLTKDFTNTTQSSYNVTSAAFDAVDQQTESPEIFMRGDSIYVVTSNTCGYCDGTIAVVYRSTLADAAQPWKRDIISGYSCGGQVEGVLPLTDPVTKDVTYVWHATTTPGGPRVGFSGHIFQPLEFNSDGSVRELNCSADAQWDVPFTPGTGSPAAGKILSAADASPRFADYEPVCDSDLFSGLYQTWTNSKTGTLSEVALNVAAGNNGDSLLVNVFKFSNISDLVSPGYKYTLLGSSVFTPLELTQVFNTATVYLNASVTQGDMLGFSIAETFSYPANFVPYCHLEHSMADSNNSSQVLLEQASGQNSFRGLSGNNSPVRVREGKGIKFFTIVN